MVGNKDSHIFQYPSFYFLQNFEFHQLYIRAPFSIFSIDQSPIISSVHLHQIQKYLDEAA